MFYQDRTMYRSIVILMLASLTGTAQAELSLDDAIATALKVDHWNQSNLQQEQALRAEAIAAAQLPDPNVRLALANLPLDTLDFNQENMTQLQLGISQQFPRGDSLALQQQKIELMAGKNPLQRQERAAQIKLNVSRSWLALHQAEQQLNLLNRNRYIFDELVAISRANFRSGKARRFEVLEAELQLTRLQDRIVQLEKMLGQQRGQLQKWLYELPAQTTTKALNGPALLQSLLDETAVTASLTRHPQMALLAQDIEVRDKGVELAEEAYKPGFKLDASYGYRDDSNSGMERADFMTVAVTMDLPLFPEKRQDQRRNAAIQKREASREMRLLKARELASGLEVAKAELVGLQQRLAIYDQTYLKQQAAKRKAALKAYAAADARFNEVAMAAVTELETRLQRIVLEHQVAQATAQINYYLAGIDPQIQTASAVKESN